VSGSGEALVVAMVNSDGKSAPVLPDPVGLTTQLHDLRLRAFARTPYDRLFTELGTLDAAERALAAGCDAVYVDSFADYGVDSLRCVTSTPVVGAGEASIGEASADGRRFSIVTVWPRSMKYLYDERLARSAGGRCCAAVHFVSDEGELDRVGTSAGVQARMRRREGKVLERLLAACDDAVQRDAPDVLLLGCTCMSPVSGYLAERISVPVVDASAAGLRAAHAAALASPPAAAPPRSRRAGWSVRLAEAWLAVGEDVPASTDECQVCAVLPTSVS